MTTSAIIVKLLLLIMVSGIGVTSRSWPDSVIVVGTYTKLLVLPSVYSIYTVIKLRHSKTA